MNVTWGDVKSEVNFLINFPGYCITITTEDDESHDVVIQDAFYRYLDGDVVVRCAPWSDDVAAADPEGEPFELAVRDIKEFYVN